MIARERLRILVIDDDDTDVELLRIHLGRLDDWSVSLRHASDVESGLDSLADEVDDLVFIDYSLGAQSGLDGLQQIVEGGIDVPVILMTGVGYPELGAQAILAGAVDYMNKASLSSRSLSRAIRNALHKHALGREIEAHRRQLEASNTELARRNAEIQRFYQTLCHELNTPLAATREFVSLVMEGTWGDLNDDQLEHLEIARRGCDEMTRYIQDLVDVTRMENGKFAIRLEPFDFPHLLRQTVKSTQIEAISRGIHLRLEVENGVGEVDADRDRVAQVLRNLIQNALKFTPREGRITVTARPDETTGEVLLTVIDTGCGIAPHDLPRIFDRLYQVNASSTTARRGLGLGLSICREIVTLHGGQLWVESEPERGSTFSFTIPLAPRPKEDSPELRPRAESILPQPVGVRVHPTITPPTERPDAPEMQGAQPS